MICCAAAADAPRTSCRRVALPAAAWLLALLAGPAWLIAQGPTGTAEVRQPENNQAANNQAAFDGERAYGYLKAICEIGPRYSGSPGMARQQELLKAHFERQGAKVTPQQFQARHPITGNPVAMANLIVEFHPDRRERILLCAHYDTRPYPDRDRRNPLGTFIGANDGASGVAVLMELAQFMADLPGEPGVDFVLFDGEELVYRDTDRYFLGSEFFASEYARGALGGVRYRWGILLDMVGDADLQIFQERYSLSIRQVRPLVRSIWETARQAGVHEFIPRPKHTVRDDHLPLNQIARIPTCNIIDFDYPYWHTEQDVPQRCSADSLGKVGRVMLHWLRAGEK